MKIDVTGMLVDLENAAIEIEPGKPMSVRTALTRALLSAPPNGRQLTGDVQIKRFDLAQRIHKNDKLDITVEEAVMAKECVAENWAPIITGQIFAVLEGGE